MLATDEESAIAQAHGAASPHPHPRPTGRLRAWWSRWMSRHVPLMDDPAPGPLDRFDGVTTRGGMLGKPPAVRKPDRADQHGGGSAS